MATKTKAEKATNVKAEALKAETPAQFARIIGHDPKKVRARLRNMGVHVSKDRTAFTKEIKAQLYDKLTAPKAEVEPKA